MNRVGKDERELKLLDEDQTLSTGQVAKLLGVDARKIRRICDWGYLVHTRPGPAHHGRDSMSTTHVRRIRVGDLADFLDEWGLPVPECLGGQGMEFYDANSKKPPGFSRWYEPTPDGVGYVEG